VYYVIVICILDPGIEATACACELFYVHISASALFFFEYVYSRNVVDIVPAAGTLNFWYCWYFWYCCDTAATLAGCCRPGSVQSLRPGVQCLHKMAPEYPSTYCQLVFGISGHCHLRSADRGHLDFPRVKLALYGGRSFAYAGPSNWNSLPAYLRDSSLCLSSFKHHLKTFLFSFY